MNSRRILRHRILDELVNRVSNNLLEYLAEAICLWVDTPEDLFEGGCLFSPGGVIIAFGWTHLSTFNDETHSYYTMSHLDSWRH